MPSEFMQDLQDYSQFAQERKMAPLEEKQQRQFNTLRDLRIQDKQRQMTPGSPENLARQLQGMVRQEKIEQFPQAAETQRIEQEAQYLEAIDKFTQQQLDMGVNGQDVANYLIDQEILPEGTKALKVDAPWGGEKVWAFQGPTDTEPTIFNEDVIRARRKLGTKKTLIREEAKGELLAEGFEWTDEDTLRPIPGGPADPTGKGANWGSMKGAPLIAKLHAYRQQLIDEGGDPKLIAEVNNQINDPPTASKILGSIMAKRQQGKALTDDDITALDIYKRYGDPLTQLLADSIGGEFQGRLQTPTQPARGGTVGGNNVLDSWDNFESFKNNLQLGDTFTGPDGKTYIYEG